MKEALAAAATAAAAADAAAASARLSDDDNDVIRLLSFVHWRNNQHINTRRSSVDDLSANHLDAAAAAAAVL